MYSFSLSTALEQVLVPSKQVLVPSEQVLLPLEQLKKVKSPIYILWKKNFQSRKY